MQRTYSKNRLAFVSPLLGVWFLMAFSAFSQARGLPDFTDLIEKHSPAVVKISTVERVGQRGQMQIPQHDDIPDIFRELFEPRRQPERDVRSMGSGFVISDDGYVLTNNHVIDGADEIVVRLIDRREFNATVVGTDPRSDLALLKIDAEKLPTLKFAKPDSIKVGQWVLAIGSPFGLDYSASVGIVSAIGRSIPSARENYVPFIQTDVAINPGNSGGPLFNLDGEVVGINSQIYTRTGGSIGLSFAIPSAVAQDVIAQLRQKGRVDRGWLGVVIQEVDRDLASSFGLAKPNGALIAQVEPQGPADRAGLRVGDVITRFGNSQVRSSSDLPHVVGRTAPETEVPVSIMREGKQQVLQVRVGTLPGSDAPVQAAQTQPTDGADLLGLVVEEVDAQLRQRWQVAGGVAVREVRRNSPAAAAGLMQGDVIAQIGFTEIESLASYRELVEKLPKDTLLPLRFFRDGRPAFRTITLSSDD